MNTVDIVVISVVGISAIIAFLRGFVREMLTIGSWLGAAAVLLYTFPVLEARFEQWIPSSKLAAHLVGGDEVGEVDAGGAGVEGRAAGLLRLLQTIVQVRLQAVLVVVEPVAGVVTRRLLKPESMWYVPTPA